MPANPTIKKPITRQAQKIENLKFLFYGAFGSGKTVLMASAAAYPEVFGRVLLLSLDRQGDLSFAWESWINNIEIADITSVSQLEEWHEYLTTVGKDEFGTVLVDGVTDLYEMAIKEALKETHDKDERADPYLPRVDHYGKANTVVRNTIRYYRDLPMHIGFSALDEDVKDESTGRLYTRPALGGKLKNSVGAYFGLVGHLTTSAPSDPNQDAPRRLQCQPTERIHAKDRTRRLGNFVINPDMGKLVHLIQSNEKPISPAPETDVKVKIKAFGGKK